jgi:hypothetical protein
VSLVLIHSVLTFGFFSGLHQHGPSGPLRDLIWLVDSTDRQDRPRLVSEIGRVFPGYELALVAAGEVTARGSRADPDPDHPSYRH